MTAYLGFNSENRNALYQLEVFFVKGETDGADFSELFYSDYNKTLSLTFYLSLCLIYIGWGPLCKVDINPDVSWGREEKIQIDTNK